MNINFDIKREVSELNDLVNSERTPNELENSILCKKLDYTIQALYFGAPGTGKSKEISELVRTVYPDIDEKINPYVFRTTVYQDYSYYDFVGTIMPITKNNGEIGYDYVEGVFTKALVKALEETDKDVFLIIEEMSRGNISTIFGDIFQLLDRDMHGESEYSINNDLIIKVLENNNITLKKIFLPSNLHIIGTVNTSDQNVNSIDSAFKRRFDFKYMKVDPKIGRDGNYLNSYEFELGGKKYEWNQLYMTLNKFISNTGMDCLSEDKQIGQFFIKFDIYDYCKKEKANMLKKDAIKNKLLHYLWNDIVLASYAKDVKIFAEKYSTFSQLYDAFEKNKNIFSDEFNEEYEKI